MNICKIFHDFIAANDSNWKKSVAVSFTTNGNHLIMFFTQIFGNKIRDHINVASPVDPIKKRKKVVETSVR